MSFYLRPEHGVFDDIIVRDTDVFNANKFGAIQSLPYNNDGEDPVDMVTAYNAYGLNALDIGGGGWAQAITRGRLYAAAGIEEAGGGITSEWGGNYHDFYVPVTVHSNPIAVSKTASSTVDYAGASFLFGDATMTSALIGVQVSSLPYQFALQRISADGASFYPISLNPRGGGVMLEALSASSDLYLDSTKTIVSQTYTGSRQGLGTGDSPAYAGLTINGSSRVNGQFQVVNSLTNDNSAYFENTSSSGYGAYFLGGGSSRYALQVVDYSGTNLFFVNGDGKTGFGTTSPAYLVDVRGTMGVTGSVAVGSASTNGVGFVLRNGSGASRAAYFTLIGTDAASADRTWYVGVNPFSSDASYEVISSASAKGLRIASATGAGRFLDALTVDGTLTGAAANFSGDVTVSRAAASDAVYSEITNTSASGFAALRLRNTGASGHEYQLGVGGHSSGLDGLMYVYDVNAGLLRLTLDPSGNFNAPGDFTIGGTLYGAAANFGGNLNAYAGIFAPQTSDEGLVVDGAGGAVNQKVDINISKAGGAYSYFRLGIAGTNLLTYGATLSSYPTGGDFVFGVPISGTEASFSGGVYATGGSAPAGRDAGGIYWNGDVFYIDGRTSSGYASNIYEAVQHVFNSAGVEVGRFCSTGLAIGGGFVASYPLDIHSDGYTNHQAATGTSHAAAKYSNDGGSIYFGLDNSDGSNFNTSEAYAGVLWRGGSNPIYVVTDSVARAKFDADGLTLPQLAGSGSGYASIDNDGKIGWSASTSRPPEFFRASISDTYYANDTDEIETRWSYLGSSANSNALPVSLIESCKALEIELPLYFNTTIGGGVNVIIRLTHGDNVLDLLTFNLDTIADAYGNLSLKIPITQSPETYEVLNCALIAEFKSTDATANFFYMDNTVHVLERDTDVPEEAVYIHVIFQFDNGGEGYASDFVSVLPGMTMALKPRPEFL